MAPRKPKPPGDEWLVVFEQMRSENRATFEAVDALRVSMEQGFDRLDRESRLRDDVLETAVRGLHVEVRQVKGDVAGLREDVKGLQGDVKTLQGQVRGLTTKVDAIVHLEERVTVLENRVKPS